MRLTMEGKDVPFGEHISLSPSFTIQTFLDKLPGDIGHTDTFLSDSISSKYYTPSEFLAAKLPKDSFSTIHLNIASLSGHIDELKELLCLLDHPFVIIGITETKIQEGLEPLIDINIPGYEFKQTPTKSCFGGDGIYIKKDFDYVVRNDLSKSINNVSESIFIEIIRNSHKNIVVGCIYRHHSPIPDFLEHYFNNTLQILQKEKNKVSVLMGDYNIDLLKVDSDSETCDFYDLLSSNGFRPLILQPTRMTVRNGKLSATLIDNIFINALETNSIGGNITVSISDHFPQFAQLDTIEKPKKNIGPRYGRSYKHFNQNEFQSELQNIQWFTNLDNKDTNNCTDFFLSKLSIIYLMKWHQFVI